MVRRFQFKLTWLLTPGSAVGGAPLRLLIFIIAALVGGTTVGTSSAGAQDFRHHWQHEYVYHVVPLYDRVTDSTRVSAMLLTGVGWFGSGSRVWLTVSFAFPGRLQIEQPEWVDVSLDSFTREGGKWAFSRSRSRELRVEVANSVRLKVPARGYVRRDKGPTDRGRRELLSFRIPAREFIEWKDELEITIRAGPAQFVLSSHAMEMVRDLIHRMVDAR